MTNQFQNQPDLGFCNLDQAQRSGQEQDSDNGQSDIEFVTDDLSRRPKPPRSEYLLFEAQPPRIMPYAPMDVNARI